jgi:hypothetical protein
MDVSKDVERYAQLHGLIRIILNIQESPSKRQLALSQLKVFTKNPENETLLKNSFDRILPTLEQLLVDRLEDKI